MAANGDPTAAFDAAVLPSLIGETLQPEIRITTFVAQHPNPDMFSAGVVLDSFSDSDLKLREEVLPKLARNRIVFPQDLV
jgi:hypothetical protein